MENSALQSLKDQINTVLDAETVLHRINYKIDSVQQSGTFLRAYCPIHKETMIRSLMLDPNKRTFRCNYFNCAGNKGGSYFDLYCLAMGLPEHEAAQRLCEELGLNPEDMAVSMEGEHKNLPKEDESPPKAEKNTQEIESEQQDAPPDDLFEAVADSPQIMELQQEEPIMQQEESAPTLDESVETDNRSEQLAIEDEPVSESMETEAAVEVQEEEILPEAEQLKPGDFQSTYQVAVTTFESNRYSSALELFRQADTLECLPDERINCRIMIGRCLIQLKRTDEALEILEDLETNPEISDLSAREILYRISEAHEKADNFEKAMETLRTLTGKYGSYRDVDSKMKRFENRTVVGQSVRRNTRISFI